MFTKQLASSKLFDFSGSPSLWQSSENSGYWGKNSLGEVFWDALWGSLEGSHKLTRMEGKEGWVGNTQTPGAHLFEPE